MLLLWRDMFNTDFGLINKLFGLNIDWFGNPWAARAAVLIVQLWMGYPYMFLVCTGALQAIPADLTEAAGVDGAKPFYAFRTITFPLLLVAVAPLLIATFAFNFNNFGAIFLVSGGGPFPADNPTVGATDLLISYTYRLAFGGTGRAVRLRGRDLDPDLHHRRGGVVHRLQADQGTGGDQLMTDVHLAAALF